MDKKYLCIDLKSFYASVECAERGLNPLTTNLVVADPERSEKTICLAVSPSMKALGVPNRCRVFQIPKGIDYIMAQPRMLKYIEYSAEIYGIYLKYVSKDDIWVYSVDEAFIDVTDYLRLYRLTAKELAIRIMDDIKRTLGVPASCGIGTNLYLTKIALDITAKHSEDGIGYLDEEIYRRTLWKHKPLTDFWRVGSGIARRLERAGINTMEDITRVDEDRLYKMFGVDAELLIDHAWGRESTTIADIKAYKPKKNSFSSGQVLSRDYGYEECMVVVKEMADALCLDLIERDMYAGSISLYLGYSSAFEVEGSRGTASFPRETSSARIIIPIVEELYKSIVKSYPVRRINMSFNNVVNEVYMQYDFFTDPSQLERENKMQHAILDIKKKFGKNAILRGMNFSQGATMIERNMQIGGHKSGEQTEDGQK